MALRSNVIKQSLSVQAASLFRLTLTLMAESTCMQVVCTRLPTSPRRFIYGHDLKVTFEKRKKPGANARLKGFPNYFPKNQTD